MENNECVIDKFKGCCCKCEYNIPLMKHPMNLDIGKGRMSEKMGYACIGFFSVNERIATFFDKEHGMCELFKQKENEQN
jgi:hypothetical protein